MYRTDFIKMKIFRTDIDRTDIDSTNILWVEGTRSFRINQES